MFATIWERYFLKEILKIFTLFLFCFYFLFVIMDASGHLQDFIRESKLAIGTACLYYVFQFVKYADIIVPLAVLVSTIKVLYGFNSHRELVALQASGIRIKTLLRPFLFLGIAATVFSFVNFEVFTPKALGFINQFYESHFKHSYHGKRKEPIHALHLKDNSKLIYQTQTPSKEYFFDVLWARDFDTIWRMKYLKADPKEPKAFFVDELKRNPQGEFEKVASHDTLLIKDLKWNHSMTRVGKTPIQNRKISELFRYLISNTPHSYTRAEVATHFAHKCLMPLLSLLVVIAVAPFCINYSRNIPIFFIYSLALFSYVAFFTLIDGAIIIGENSVVPPILAIGAPFALLGSIFGLRFAKL